MKTLTRLEIKNAILNDGRFRDLFPELKDKIAEIIHNPGCACNVPKIDKFFGYKDRLSKYFSNRDVKEPKDEVREMNQNHWKVHNCHVDEIEGVLNGLHKVGRYQIAVARYEDRATIVVNSLGIMF